MTHPQPPARRGAAADPAAPATTATTATTATPYLSAVLITLDEERHLEECLASLAGVADEIVVVDSGSRDRTAELARAAGARLAVRAFDGYGPQKQAALDLAGGEWVLSIDADERVTPALAAEIRRVTRDPGAPAGLWVRRELVYLGVPLRHGGAESDWVLRLARRRSARFSADVVHERLIVDGGESRLAGTLLHLKYRTLSEHLATIDRYTTMVADRKRASGATFSAWQLLRIPWELFARLVLRLGVLDGRAGVIHAAMASYYAFLKYAKLWRGATPPEGGR